MASPCLYCGSFYIFINEMGELNDKKKTPPKTHAMDAPSGTESAEGRCYSKGARGERQTIRGKE